MFPEAASHFLRSREDAIRADNVEFYKLNDDLLVLELPPAADTLLIPAGFYNRESSGAAYPENPFPAEPVTFLYFPSPFRVVGSLR